LFPAELIHVKTALVIEETPPVTGSIDAKSDASRIPQDAPPSVATPAAAEASAEPEPQPVEPAPQQVDPARETFAASPTPVAASPSRAEPAAAEPAPPAVRSARVTTHVNMRAEAENSAAVLTVVPAGKNVQVVECRGWCEVSYEGQQGFIHQRFLKE
jgi:hypothetical protein